MTTKQQRGSQEKDEPAIYVGEPLRLTRDFGERLLFGVLPGNVGLPGRHVHPAVRQAGERILIRRRCPIRIARITA
jgi:hypothetical protein